MSTAKSYRSLTSFEGYDRGETFEHYRNIESLWENVLTAQDWCHAERFHRCHDGPWTVGKSNDLSAMLELHSINSKLSIADIYWKVDISEDPGNPTT